MNFHEPHYFRSISRCPITASLVFPQVRFWCIQQSWGIYCKYDIYLSPNFPPSWEGVLTITTLIWLTLIFTCSLLSIIPNKGMKIVLSTFLELQFSDNCSSVYLRIICWRLIWITNFWFTAAFSSKTFFDMLFIT